MNEENKKTEYTGEYGNVIEGSYREIEQEDNGQEPAMEAGAEQGRQEPPAEENPANGQKKPQENSIYSYSYQNSRSRNAQSTHSGDYYSGEHHQPQKPKKETSFAKKILVTAACAILFGLISGICFNGVNYLFGTVKEETSKNSGVMLSKTTSQIAGNTAKSANDGDVTAIVEQTMPAIVAITSTTKGANYYDLFGREYEGQESTSAGTGFIIGQNNKELLIATNNHVVDGAKTISIKFIDGEVYEATEKGADSSNDLAVVAVKTSTIKQDTMNQIKIADMGNSDDIKVGEKVVAIGNALGYGQSVTVGYISAKDREITESSSNGMGQGNTIKALQTDAAINPGNSGGALINMQGQVVGINSAKISGDTVEGVGYAIPISVATPIIDELVNRETLSDDERGYLGISGATISKESNDYNLPYGVYVKEVSDDGAAAEAGLMVGDIITAVNKMEVTTMESLKEKVNSYRVGTKITLTVKRISDGKYKEQKISVTLKGKESLEDLDEGTAQDSQQDNSTENRENNDSDGFFGNNGWFGY